MAKHTVAALFDSRAYASDAVLKLRQAGIPDADVSISPESALTDHSDAESRVTGVWGVLERLFGGTHDHSTYAEGVRRGGIMVTADVDEGFLEDAIDILDRHGSIDLNEREAAWRHEGWTGPSGRNTASAETVDSHAVHPMTHAEAERAAVAVLAAASPVLAYKTESTPGSPTTGPDPRDGVLQVVEGTDTMGKRSMNGGKVRIRSHEVETPFAPQSGTARSARQTEDIEVVGSDGEHVGTLEHVDGTSIRLKRMGTPDSGPPPSIPTAWVHTIDGKVTLRIPAEEARRRWTTA